MSFIDIIFVKLGKSTFIQAKTKESFAEVVKRYSLKIGENISGVVFIFNCHQLKINSTKSLSELKIKNLSKIEVVTTHNVKNYDGDFYLKFIYNSKTILVPSYNFDPFEKVIERLKYLADLDPIKLKHLRFFRNSEELIVEPGIIYDFDKDDVIYCLIDLDNIKLRENLKKANNVINILKNKLQEANKTIEQLNQENYLINKKLNDLKNNCNNNDQIQNLNNIIASKQKEIEELKKDNNKIKNKNSYVKYEDIRMLQFMTGDGIINNYPIKCLISETFAEVEERLYQIFPEFRETNNTFISNGNDIKRFKKISENNIKEGSPIQLIVPA